MHMITERVLWDMMSLPSPDLSREIFENPLMVRLCTIFKIIKDAREQIGVTKYEMSIKSIRDELATRGDDIDESTVYRYIRKAMSSGLLIAETKTVVSYQKLSLIAPRQGEVPNLHLVDVDGIDIPPFTMNGTSIYAEKGESTFKIYRTSEKGENLLLEAKKHVI